MDFFLKHSVNGSLSQQRRLHLVRLQSLKACVVADGALGWGWMFGWGGRARSHGWTLPVVTSVSAAVWRSPEQLVWPQAPWESLVESSLGHKDMPIYMPAWAWEPRLLLTSHLWLWVSNGTSPHLSSRVIKNVNLITDTRGSWHLWL